jgi:hypothetical protein
MKPSLVIALTLVCALDCGGDVIIPLPADTGWDVQAPGDTNPRPPDEINAANCTFLQRCNPSWYNNWFLSMDDCLAYGSSSYGNPSRLPGVTQSEINAIVAWANTGSCATLNSYRPTGSLPIDGTCDQGLQCASGMCNTGIVGCGYCIGDALGEACTFYADCAAPNACLAGFCEPLQANGAACADGSQCQSGYCAPGFGTYPSLDGVCQDPPALPAGASCNGSFDDCAVGLECNSAAVCAQPVYVAIGQPCTQESICNGGYCDPATTICTAYTAPGSPCTSSIQCRSQCVPTTDGGTAGVCDVPAFMSCN